MNKISKKLDEKLAHNEKCLHDEIETLKTIEKEDANVRKLDTKNSNYKFLIFFV